jgi:hypothetical protein
MAKIHAPNKQYTGVSASVAFAQGVGETTDPYLIEWFRSHGYEVEEDPEENEFKGKTIEELKAYALEHSIDIGNSTSISGITKKIQDALKAGE